MLDSAISFIIENDQIKFRKLLNFNTKLNENTVVKIGIRFLYTYSYIH